MKRALKTWGLVPCLTLAAMEALYLIAGNVFLRTSAFERTLNGNPEEIYVKTREAYTLFPGWVKTGRVQVRGQDSNVQWLVEVENARLLVSLPDLIWRRSFHVTRLDAEAGAFQIRLRTLAETSRPEEISELPPIPGFAPETLQKKRAQAERRAKDLVPKTDTGLKQVQIENIHIPGFRQIWIDAYRFDGKVDVTGSFTLDLGRRLVIPTGRLQIISGAIERRDQRISDNLIGVVDAEIRDFQVKRDLGLDFFKTVGARIALQGRLESFDPLSYLLRNQDWLRLRRMHGAFSVEAVVRDGRVVDVPVAAVKSKHFAAAFSHFLISGVAQAGFKLDERKDRGSLEFELPEYRISGEKNRKALLKGRSLKITLDSPDLDLAHLYRRVKAQVALPEARIADFSFLNRWIPSSSGIAVKKGGGTLSARLAVSNDPSLKPAPGSIAVDTEPVQIRKGDHDLVGKIRTRIHVAQVFHQSKRLKELNVAGSEVHASGSLLNGKSSWKTDLEIVDGAIRPDASALISARMRFRMPDISPFLDEFGVQSGLGKAAQDLLASGRFEGSTDVTLGDRWIELDRIRLISERSQVRGFLHLRKQAKQALVLLHAWPVSVGVEIDNQGTHVQLLGADEWFKDKIREKGMGLTAALR